MDYMDGSELYGRVLTVNYALPEKIKRGEQSWVAHPHSLSECVCGDSDEGDCYRKLIVQKLDVEGLSEAIGAGLGAMGCAAIFCLVNNI